MRDPITYFMWGYQELFRVSFAAHAKRTLNVIAPDLLPEVLLVGLHLTSGEGFDVCVEPEDGKWPLDLFEGLGQPVEENYAAHSDQNTFYGDAPSMQRKPMRMRADATRDATSLDWTRKILES